MNWIISYVDVRLGETFAGVEDKCLKGWEPFAITLVLISNEIAGRRAIESNVQRFWFKRKTRGKSYDKKC